MRYRNWLLTTCGILTLAVAVSVADEQDGSLAMSGTGNRSTIVATSAAFLFARCEDEKARPCNKRRRPPTAKKRHRNALRQMLLVRRQQLRKRPNNPLRREANRSRHRQLLPNRTPTRRRHRSLLVQLVRPHRKPGKGASSPYAAAIKRRTDAQQTSLIPHTRKNVAAKHQSHQTASAPADQPAQSLAPLRRSPATARKTGIEQASWGNAASTSLKVQPARIATFEQKEFFRPVDAPPAKAATPSAPSNQSGLTHADYESVPATANAGFVQQASGTDDGPNPFAEFEIMVDEPAGDGGPADPFDLTPQESNPFDAPPSAVSTPDLPAPPQTQTAVVRPAVQSTVQSTSLNVVQSQSSSGGSDLLGPQSPVLTIEWKKPASINVGQPCECELLVRNNGQAVTGNVIVEAHFPPSVRLQAADPEPAQASDYLAWTLGELGPGNTQRIRIQLVPTERGDFQTSAFVRFSGRHGRSLHGSKNQCSKSPSARPRA